MKKSFTLAEVLITLGIIGVVSALVIPNFLIRVHKNIAAAKLRQAHTILVQAARNADLDNGGSIRSLLPTDSYGSNYGNDTKHIFRDYFAPYMKDCIVTDKKWTPSTSSGERGTVIIGQFGAGNSYCIPNGMCFIFTSHGINTYTYIVVDLNGPEKPNRVGRDVFYFAVSFTNKGTIINGKVWAVDSATSLDTLYNECSKTGTGGNMGVRCTEIIMRNNWKIPNDPRYPW